MITVDEAYDIIVGQSQYFGVDTVPFIESLGKVLKETIVADRDFPPFDRVCMDGIAISAAAFENGKRSFLIEGVQAAGSPQMTLENFENCLEVMTGAVLPKNTDAVIPYELIAIENGMATVSVSSVVSLQNIHVKGKDRKINDILIHENTCITAAEIGVLATVGKSYVKVLRQPKVMIISTGNELVGVDEVPLEHQIRRSNVFSLVSLLSVLQIKADTAHLPDDKESLKENISQFLKNYDTLLFSGAVSKGKFDYIPEVLNELGVEKLFHKVKQRPGKPFWFGRSAVLSTSELEEDKNTSKKQTVVFAFPGNPVSTYVNCLKYFYPWYKKSMGMSLDLPIAKLSEDFAFKPSMTYFLQVKLLQENGVLIAVPQTGNGSGDLANLVEADAFIELPEDRNEFKKGEAFPILRYR
ncbi:molybdopterin molybdotransferase MoeA [Flavicella sediminum]|uniref:molybdopterin molybdotransferase MoeA n=1 Tax=Flavicella sediminum TaxID=2585141 RepID=UPI001120D3ED|nr:molybdopterin molybdotransferase MoeA [Flavicella sediminum]